MAEAFEVELAVVAGKVVLAGDSEQVALAQRLQVLRQQVELGGLGEVRQVAGVEDQVGGRGQGVDLGDGRLQRRDHVGVSGLVEADVSVADLHEAEARGLRGLLRGGVQ